MVSMAGGAAAGRALAVPRHVLPRRVDLGLKWLLSLVCLFFRAALRWVPAGARWLKEETSGTGILCCSVVPLQRDASVPGVS